MPPAPESISSKRRSNSPTSCLSSTPPSDSARCPTPRLRYEAHHFRNRGLANSIEDGIRSRYWKLYDLTAGKSVFLLTATPVNNHLTDFQHLIELFSRIENPGAFAKTLGIHALPA
jgi:hypothetical protein